MQDTTEKPLKPLTGGNIRPFDKVSITYVLDTFAEMGSVEEVHPALAEKLVKAGKAEYTDKADADMAKTKKKDK